MYLELELEQLVGVVSGTGTNFFLSKRETTNDYTIHQIQQRVTVKTPSTKVIPALFHTHTHLFIGTLIQRKWFDQEMMR